MYKITCNNVSYLKANNYGGAEFKGVAYTDSEEIANEFAHNGLSTGGTPLFEVEEVTEATE